MSQETASRAIAERSADAVNKDLGAPLQALVQQLVAERAETLAWQSARGTMPRSALDGERTAPMPP